MKIAITYLVLLDPWTFKINLHKEMPRDPHLPFRFYIYEWPQNITDVYPNSSVPLVRGPKGRGGLVTIYKHHRYRKNAFFGDLVLPEIGLYETFAWALYKLIEARLARHPLRTYNRNEADAFFVPFDVGFNAVISTEHGRERGLDWSGCDKAQYASQHLTKEFTTNMKNNKHKWGHDHFLVFDFCNAQHMGEECYKFLSMCRNCTVLSIESLLYKTPYTNYIDDFYSKNSLPIIRKWRGVPFPAAIHWHDDINQKSYPWDANKYNRQRLAVFWGNPQVLNRAGCKLRKVIISQCEASKPEDCAHYGSGPHGRAHHPITDLLYYTNTTFCLHPTGDAETRKAIFDSMLLGCIPVVFTPQLMYRVYTWFFTLEDARATSVYIPMESILKGGVNIVEALRAIPIDKIKSMQAAIQRLAPSLQYSAPPSTAKVWSPPFPDAVDIILSKIEQRISVYDKIGEIPDDERFVRNNYAKAINEGENRI
eukprot:gene8043-16489_t